MKRRVVQRHVHAVSLIRVFAVNGDQIRPRLKLRVKAGPIVPVLDKVNGFPELIPQRHALAA